MKNFEQLLQWKKEAEEKCQQSLLEEIANDNSSQVFSPSGKPFQDSPYVVETDDPISEFPQVKITDTFLQDIVRLIPEDEDGEGCEFLFRKWIKVVKNYYPKDCTDSFTWLMTSWLLFVKYANIIWVTASENKKQVVWNLVDRFDQAFDKFKNKTMKKAV